MNVFVSFPSSWNTLQELREEFEYIALCVYFLKEKWLKKLCNEVFQNPNNGNRRHIKWNKKKTAQNSKRKSRINNAVNIKGGTDGQI